MPNNICIYFILLSLSFSSASQSKNSEHGAGLCEKEESLLFGFKISDRYKYMSLCEGRGENYLTYRFGTPDNVEFQYPEILDESSWEKFNLHGYSRGGGIANDATGDYSTSFTNQGIEYTIFQNWRLVSNEYFLGILINIGEKRIVLRGEQGSQSGSLMVLEGKEKLKNEQDAQ